MSTKLLDESTVVTEQMLIEEYLNDQGYSPRKLKELPERVVKQLMREATRYATNKLEETKVNTHTGALHHN
jgi:hypothetical protein